jgi:hypothetical protein
MNRLIHIPFVKTDLIGMHPSHWTGMKVGDENSPSSSLRLDAELF